MKKFFLFLGGLIAFLIVLANLGPLVLLGVSLWLLYLVFKQFMKSDSIGSKVLWVILGIMISSVALSNIYAVIGVAAAYVLYIIYKNWNDEQELDKQINDPFINFEEQWGELNKN